MTDLNALTAKSACIKICLCFVMSCYPQTNPATKPVPEPPTRTSLLQWGLYQIYWEGPAYYDRLDTELKTLDGSPRFVMFFRDLIRPFPLKPVQFNESRGLLTIISLELTVWGSGKKIRYLPEILRGEFDHYFREWARGAAMYNKPVVYRFGFEMNGDWFGWGEQPKEFVKAWRRVYTIFTEEGADKVIWFFSPNVLWDNRSFEKDLDPYFPGGDVVNWVGLDGYNFGNNSDSYHTWQDYESIFLKSLRAIERYGKPIYIAEVGCAHGPRKALWIEDFLKKATDDRRIHGFVWFNYDKTGEGSQNWRLDSDPKSLKLFQYWAGRHSSNKKNTD